MKSLKFPNSDLSEMRLFYEEELDKTVKKLQHIKSVLEQLGGASPQIVINIEGETSAPAATVGQKKSSGKVKTKKATKAASKSGAKGKRGRKSTWEPLLLNRLQVIDKPVTYDELTEDVMAFSKLPKSKLKSTKQAVVNMVFRLRADGKKVDTFANGSREKYVALKAWFDKPGKINKDYLAKLSPKEPTKTATLSIKAKPKAKVSKPKAKVIKKVAAVKTTSPATKTVVKKAVSKSPKAKAATKSTAKKAVVKKTAVKSKKTSVLKKAKDAAVKTAAAPKATVVSKKSTKKPAAKKKVAKSTAVKASTVVKADSTTPVAKKAKTVKKVAAKKTAKPAVKKKVVSKKATSKKPAAKKAVSKTVVAKEVAVTSTPENAVTK